MEVESVADEAALRHGGSTTRRRTVIVRRPDAGWPFATRLAVPAITFLLVASTAMVGCSDTTSPTTTTATTMATSTTEDTSPFGHVQDFLNEVAPSMGVEPRFALPRLRVTPDFEAQFIETFRTASVADGLNVDLGIWSDDQLLYLGYLYCVGLDAGVTADESVTVVVATVATSQGRAPEGATNADAAVGVATARYAGGSICGEYRLATEDLLLRLGGTTTTP